MGSNTKRQKLTNIRKWLKESLSNVPNKNYTHLLLEEELHVRTQIIGELTEYFRAAHEPVKIYLRSILGDSLHPFVSDPQIDPAYGYPEKLHPTTLQEYFGEVFAGIIAEHYNLFGSDRWEIPVFLFHTHNVVFQHLEFIKQTGELAKHVPGRTGDDCLAFERDQNGAIHRIMFCEAKCTTTHRTDLIKDNHRKLSSPVTLPVDLRQVIHALQYFGDDEYAREWINALRLIYLKKIQPTERCDLSLYACGQKPIINSTWISTTDPHPNYTGGRRLTAVEVHLNGIQDLIKEAYNI